MNSNRMLLSLIITACLVQGDYGQSWEYAFNDKSFDSTLNNIDKIDYQLVVLYFADNDNCDIYDEPVKNVVSSFLDVLVIRVNTDICREAQERVSTNHKPFIKNHPTFVLRQKGSNLDMFDTFKNIGDELSSKINHAKGFIGNTFKVASSDDDLSAKLKAVDENGQMAVIYFVFKNTDHDEFANSVAQSFPNIVVIKVDTFFCSQDDNRFEYTEFPAFFVRQSKQNKEQYEGNHIDVDDMINKINGYYGNKFQLASSANDLSAKLKAVDENGQMAVIYFVHKNTDYDELGNYVAQSFPNVVVIKVDRDFCPREDNSFEFTHFPAYFVRKSTQNIGLWDDNVFDENKITEKIVDTLK